MTIGGGESVESPVGSLAPIERGANATTVTHGSSPNDSPTKQLERQIPAHQNSLPAEECPREEETLWDEYEFDGHVSNTSPRTNSISIFFSDANFFNF